MAADGKKPGARTAVIAATCASIGCSTDAGTSARSGRTHHFTLTAAPVYDVLSTIPYLENVSPGEK
ncbi:MAG: hypothetical protein ABWY64_06965 [Tardiphaga sp.]